MKSKKTIALLILVIGIWGAIGYRVWQHLSEEEPPVRIPKRKITALPPDFSDRYPLMLNYDDPFLREIRNRRKEMSTGPKKVVTARPQPAAQPQQPSIIVAWDKIEYLGSVHNATRNSLVALVRFNGTDHMSRQGDAVEMFKITQIYKDSIEVACGSQKKIIRKKQ